MCFALKLKPRLVYPRAYGETIYARHFPEGGWGLSPRLRGNHK